MSSREVDEAVGERKTAVDVLVEKREALDVARQRYATAKAARDEVAMSDEGRLIDSLHTIIRELEQEAQAEVEARGQRAADARMLGIKKAFGSVLSEYKKEDEGVEQCREQLGQAISKRNARAAKLEGLEKEANALSDRFGFPMPKLEYPDEPRSIELPENWRLAVSRPQTEETTDGTARSRRSYAEIKGTHTYEIIQQAGGPKPFRPLTEAEQKALARTEAQRARTDVDPFVAAEAATIAGLPSTMPVSGAGIFRG